LKISPPILLSLPDYPMIPEVLGREGSETEPCLENQPRSAGRHIPALDGLRGLAILAVMIFHYRMVLIGSGWIAKALDCLAASGGMGVNLFFVLSGFLITGILWDSKEEPGYLRNFFARRFLRIFPLYYGTLFVGLILVPSCFHVSDPKYLSTVHHQLWLWTYTSNFYECWTGRAMPLFGHFWSLAVEEHFYLIWPFVVLASTRGTLMRVCVGCFVAAFLFRWALLPVGGNPTLAVSRLTPCQIDALATGAFLAMAARNPRGARPLIAPRCLMPAFGLSAVVVGAFVFHLPGTFDAIPEALSGSCISIFFGLMLCVALAGPPFFQYFFQLRALRLLGKYSYGLYVFHWPIGRFWLIFMQRWSAGGHSFLLNPILFQTAYFVAAASSSLLAAWLRYHFYESYFLRLKRYFRPREDQPVEPALF
jgi:peptidoglycan/LPS O-acetylase OafA/YrhL